jgi:hypothetical protein
MIIANDVEGNFRPQLRFGIFLAGRQQPLPGLGDSAGRADLIDDRGQMPRYRLASDPVS